MALHRKLRALLDWMRCFRHGCLRLWSRRASAQSRPSKAREFARRRSECQTRGARGCRTLPAARRGGAVRRRAGQGSVGRAGDRRIDGRSSICAQCRRIFHAGFRRKIIYHRARARHARPGLSRADHSRVERRARCERRAERRSRSDRAAATRISPTGNFHTTRKRSAKGRPKKFSPNSPDAVAARGVKEVTGRRDRR